MLRSLLARFMVLPVVVFLPLAGLPLAVSADEVKLRVDHPERHTVVRGDTLWDISAAFLKDPWQWPKVWKLNPQIHNPHLIYPGDVVVLTYDETGKPTLEVLRRETAMDGSGGGTGSGTAAPGTLAEVKVAEDAERPTHVVRLSPEAHETPLEDAIPTINPAAIRPFLTQPLVIARRDLDRAGHITHGLDDRVALGNGSEFYARGLPNDGNTFFHIFRSGGPLKDPDTGKLLAYEATYLGDAQVTHPGDPARLVVTRVTQEILPTDRLLVAPKVQSLPYYQPRPPGQNVAGRILSAHNGLREFGPNTVVAINLGASKGMEEGHVLKIMRHVGQRADPVSGKSYRIPDEASGLLMVFRTFEKVSYALVLDANRPIHLHDSVVTP